MKRLMDWDASEQALDDDGILTEVGLTLADEPQHLCLEQDYDTPTGWESVATHQHIAHIRRMGEEKRDESPEKHYPVRRWVVERTLAWLSK